MQKRLTPTSAGALLLLTLVSVVPFAGAAEQAAAKTGSTSTTGRNRTCVRSINT